ncbi:MAG: CehA/McbA family metallohydrolase [Planctomycetaceae bacterium]
MRSLLLAASLIGCCWPALVTSAANSTPPAVVSLPSAETWEAQSAVARENKGAVELELTVNYVNGRIRSAPVPASSGELFTLAGEVITEFPINRASYYRFWMSLEFLEGERVTHIASSAEIVGGQDRETLVAITGVAPAGTTKVRAVLHAQNKYWALLKNRTVVKQLRLLKLSGGRGGALKFEATKPIPKVKGARTVTLTVRGDWPDGTAVTMATTRGEMEAAALIDKGKAESVLRYSEEDVGSTVVSAGVDNESTTTSVLDAYAGGLAIREIVADGSRSPALVRLSRDGAMLPGRYQSSMPGIFLVPPYSTDLAPGTWELEVCRGPQFEPFRQELRIVSGKTEQIDRLELRRRVDLRSNGWYGGDADGDVYHGERIYTDISAQTAADIAQAMGLDWVGVGSWGIKPKDWAEARAHMRPLSGSQLLFMWTDERPKTRYGHACFLGLTGPDAERLGWAWTGPNRTLENFEVLQAIRANGGATFVNHPLRWWMKGDRFNTNMYSSLAFDLCAAGALDGLNINDDPDALQLWSMLLDNGYRVAATAGADFGLDRPAGPVPGKARMYCFCPEGLSEQALAQAVRDGHTMVSTGPLLTANIQDAPPGSMVAANVKHKISVQTWARGDQTDPLQRLELWAHGKVLEEYSLGDTQSGTHEFQWQPSEESDWVAVRAVSKQGWAMTSAFYADGKQWRSRRPVDCELTLDIRGLRPEQMTKGVVEAWDRAPSLPGAKRIQQQSLSGSSRLTVPVTATIILRIPQQPVKESLVFDALGVREILDKIAAGALREQPLLDWKSYQQVLDRCHSATLQVSY